MRAWRKQIGVVPRTDEPRADLRGMGRKGTGGGAIHSQSRRAGASFMKEPAAIPKACRIRVFGHVKGSFTAHRGEKRKSRWMLAPLIR